MKKKVDLNGVSETLLLPLYARAKFSQTKKDKFYDQKAIDLVNSIEYDFSLAEKDKAMSSGAVARSLVFDELVKEYIAEHPDAVIVNLGCGLDTRFYRLDNGTIEWYNLDFGNVIQLRRDFLEEDNVDRVHLIGATVTDKDWPTRVKHRNANMLFIIEGLSMYLPEDQVKRMLEIIYKNFEHAYVMMETISTAWVQKEAVEQSVQATGARFLWGCNGFAEMKDIAPGYVKVKDDNIIRGMNSISPSYRLISWLPIATTLAQKILIFKKEAPVEDTEQL